MRIIFSLILTLHVIHAQVPKNLQEAKSMAKKAGLTKNQAIEIAKSKGYTSEAIKNAMETGSMEKSGEIEKTNANNYRETSELEKSKIDESNLDSEQNLGEKQPQDLDKIDNENIDEIDLINPNKVITEKELKYFGYNIFESDPKVFQNTNAGAVNPDYVIGPNDEIIVMLWGETQFRQVLKVDREGFVFIPDIGQVFVNGLKLNLLESKLFRILSKSYASLNPISGDPTTFFDLSLGNLRPIRIQVLGQVKQPGAYTVSPSTTLFSALYYFNGPSYLGSLRDIRLIRDNKDIISVDFYDYLLSGKKPNDIQLQIDDVIFIPKRGKTVSVEGQISIPAVYELKNNESLVDLINISGGLINTAYVNRAQIDRVIPYAERAKANAERMFLDIDLSEVIYEKKSIPLEDGDAIKIFKIKEDRLNIVQIEGAVNRPGVYEFNGSMSLKELIIRADSLYGDSYLERADIIRVNPDLTEELIKIDLGRALNDDPEHNIFLIPLDKITIYSNSEMRPIQYVEINGYVKSPGKYPLLENMRVNDLVFKAAGLEDSTFKAKTYLQRADLIRYDENQIDRKILSLSIEEILNDQDARDNVLLKANDELRIYPKKVFIKKYYVEIDGAVVRPGKYELKSKMELKDLIYECGGMIQSLDSYRLEVAKIDPITKSQGILSKIFIVQMDRQYELLNVVDGTGKSYALDEFKLDAFDYVSVRKDQIFKDQETVQIIGQVNLPGTYVISYTNETVYDLIQRAGGLKNEAFLQASYLERKGQRINLSLSSKIKKARSGLLLKNKDLINISEKTDVVKVVGEVSSPGIYKFVKNKKVDNYINSAGGFTLDAEKKDIWISFPNGRSKKWHPIWSNPKVLDSSVINVGKKIDAKPVDKTEILKEISSILADFAQVIAIVVLARG